MKNYLLLLGCIVALGIPGFGAVPRNKAGLQRVRVSTETPGFEIAAADNVWVPAANEAAGSKKN